MRKQIFLLTVVAIVWLALTANAQSLIETPECINYDSLNNRYLVSCFQAGRVIQIDMDGNEDYFISYLGSAFSNHISGDTFYVSNGANVFSIDLNNPDNTFWSKIITGSHQLDGLTTDSSGNLYICDYDFSNSMPDAVFKIDIATQTYSRFVDEDDNLAPAPQDIIFDAENNRLIVVGFSTDAPIQAISLPDGTISTLTETTLDGFDGIAFDSHGNYYVSCWSEGAVYRLDNTFTNPPVLISSGYNGSSNIGYNRPHDILAVSVFNENRIDFINMRVAFDADKTSGQVPLDINFSGFSLLNLSVDSWNWDFGDGNDGSGQTPVHTYTDPGIYEVTLNIGVGDTTYSEVKQDFIIALSDTLIGIDAQGDPGSTVEVAIYANNTIPINWMRIPIEYPGLLNIALDSFSTSGCRTDYFDNIVQNDNDPLHWETAFTIYNNSGGGTPDLEPGSGPILKLYFTIPPSAVFGRTSSIILDGYGSYNPEFKGPLLDYIPICSDGTVSLIGICGDADDNGLVNILDIIFLISFLYKSGPAPSNPETCDVNGDGSINILDITYLIGYLYSSGPEPDCG